MSWLFNKNVLQVVAGFAAGYFTKSAMIETHRNKDLEKTDVASLIQRGQKIYDAATSHPERIPGAFESAEKTLTGVTEDESSS